MIRLACASPGLISGPDSPPFNIDTFDDFLAVFEDFIEIDLVVFIFDFVERLKADGANIVWLF